MTKTHLIIKRTILSSILNAFKKRNLNMDSGYYVIHTILKYLLY